MGAWKVLLELLPELRAYSRALSSDREIADDAVSDALESAAKSRSLPNTYREARFWMFRAIRNKQLDAHRRNQVRRDTANITAIQQNQPRPADPEAQAVIRDALEKLQPRDRKVIELVDVLGLTYAEAARALDVPVGTIMSRISRARAALMTILKDDESPESNI